MAILFSLCVAALLVLAFYIYFTWTFDHWKNHNVPFESPTVFVGNMTFLLRDSISSFMRRIYSKFEGHDYFGIWVFREPVLVIRSPKMAKEILTTKFNYFIDRAMETHESDVLGAKCLIFAKGDHWIRLRKRLSPAFTKAKIRNILINRMPAISKELCEYIDKAQHGPFNIKELFMKYILEVIAGNIFGIRANSMQDNNAPFLKLGMSFVNWNLLRGLELTSTALFKNLVKLFRFKFFTKENNDYMRTLFVKILESREMSVNDMMTHSRDVLDALLQLKNDSDFTEDDIIAQAAVLFFAGFETTSTVLSLLAYEMAFNKEFQECLYQEVKKVLAGRTEFEFDDLDNMRLLEMSIKETIRKYPTVPYSDRLCGADCELSGGLIVKKGTRVLVCTSGLHFDPKYHPEPDTWNPYRFENEEGIVPYTFLPFSEGQRICIGAKYGMMSIKWSMVSLVMRYRFEPCADTVPPWKMRSSPYTLLCAPKEAIKLNIVRR